MSRKKKATLVAALLVAVLTLSIGYAALSASLNINGTANVSGEKWQVNFVKDEATESSTGQATCDIGTIEDTSITDLSAIFKIPGDSCTFTVPVENTGTLSASLTEVIGRDSRLTFTGSEDDQAILENNVVYSVNYGGTEINDETTFENIYTLEPGEKETITLKVTFRSEATKVPKASVTVGGLDRTFVFENKTATTDPTAEVKYSVKYEGFDSAGFKTRVQKGETFTQNIGNINIRSVTMGDVFLSNSQYSFENSVITITNVTGDIVITAVGATPSYKDSCEVHPNAPVLNGDMIPVVYNEDKQVWQKQDLNKSYDYCNQVWANAVTIVSDKRDEIKNAKAGTTIPMDYINTMWVWIPRYSYTIKSEDGGTNYFGKASSENSNPTQDLPGEIDVKFILTSENDTTGSAQYIGSNPTNWRTNDAFNFGGEQHAGIWVSKFEPTGTSPECTNTSCDVGSVTVKPGVASITNKTVSSFFYMARSMQMNNTQTYGFDKTKGDLHMMKNDEWGAVAYLSQSRYGKQGNSNYSGANKEVYINNNSSYITGTSGGGPSVSYVGAHYKYDDMTNLLGTGRGQAGPGASTTGTIYGVYDMNGGAAEYVMGVLEYDSQTESEHPGQIATGKSGFEGLNSKGSSTGTVDLPNEKYYNTYKSANPTSSDWTSAKPESACDGGVCFGHALSETVNWYSDTADFVDRAWSWFFRSGDYSSETTTGVFRAICDGGGSHSNYSVRLVLV